LNELAVANCMSQKPGLMQPAWPHLAIITRKTLFLKRFMATENAARLMLFNDE
jgi:hypothetical protein